MNDDLPIPHLAHRDVENPEPLHVDSVEIKEKFRDWAKKNPSFSYTWRTRKIKKEKTK